MQGQRKKSIETSTTVSTSTTSASAATGRWPGLSVPSFLPEILPAVEVGWRLGEQFWGQGYATEAGAAWVRHGFEDLGLTEIVSVYEPENTASGSVMQRLGFTLARATTHPAMGVPLHVMALTEASWRETSR